MNYDRDILERVLRELESEKIRCEAECEEKRRRIYRELPRVGEIDAALRTTALDIIRASFGKGEDTASLLRKTREKNLALQREREELLCGAGYCTAALEPEYSCDICNDEGYAGGELCVCVAKRYRRAVAKEINASLRLCGADFSRFDINVYPETGGSLSPRAQMREIFEFCRSYADSFDDAAEDLFMSGGSGLGKSFLASCIAQKVADSGFSVVFDTAFSVLGIYEDVKFGRSAADTSVFETCDLLVLDDLGCEMTTPFSVAALYNLINLRRAGGRKTVVISSLSDSDIKKRYGAQLFSRLAGDFIKLEFMGNDIRLMR
ncbi:MAG: ATP-binding protein [Oscillospiraceae bacterium]|nr:ATP-binding protein [Oscillospiraceae bacterium]